MSAFTYIGHKEQQGFVIEYFKCSECKRVFRCLERKMIYQIFDRQEIIAATLMDKIFYDKELRCGDCADKIKMANGEKGSPNSWPSVIFRESNAK